MNTTLSKENHLGQNRFLVYFQKVNTKKIIHFIFSKRQKKTKKMKITLMTSRYSKKMCS